jgi:putative membrane protein
MWWNNYPGSGHMDGWGTSLVALVLLVVLVATAVVLVMTEVMTRRSAGTHPSGGAKPDHGPDPEAKRILDRRFAAGEIDEEEYLRRTATLRQAGMT